MAGLHVLTTYLRTLLYKMYKKPTKTSPRSWILNTILQLKTRAGPLEKWLLPKMGQGVHKMNPEHLVVPQSKEVLTKRWGFVERMKEPTWRNSSNSQRCKNLSNKATLLLNFNPQNKINIQESTVPLIKWMGEKRQLFLKSIIPISVEVKREMENHHLQNITVIIVLDKIH